METGQREGAVLSLGIVVRNDPTDHMSTEAFYIDLLDGRKDVEGMAAWDRFLMASPRGHPLVLSTWLRSFQAYGFRFDVMVARSERTGQILGGLGIILLGIRGFGAALIPIGPIVVPGHTALPRALVSSAIDYAKSRHAFLMQIQFPISTSIPHESLLTRAELPEDARGRGGILIRLGAAARQLLWIELPETSDDLVWEQSLLDSFAKNTRRDIRKALRLPTQITEATSAEEIREGYAVIQRNGGQLGYATRAWSAIGPTLVDQVHCGHAIMLVARFDGCAVGAHYGGLAGRRWTYLMGGTARMTPDLLVGHRLHWEALRKARALGLHGYDLGPDGSEGVLQFKMGFRPTRIPLVEPVHFVLGSTRYRAMRAVYPAIARRKASVARFLSGLRTKRGPHGIHQ